MKRFNLVLLLFLSLSFFSFKELPKLKHIDIIPRPAYIDEQPGEFVVGHNTRILVSDHDSLTFEADYLANIIRKHTDLNVKIVSVSYLSKSHNHDITLRLVPNSYKSDEGYQLRVGKDGISIFANTSAGIFYGIQSLLQLFPNSFYKESIHNKGLSVPYCTIKDQPRFAYRGMHLDVSRHFFPPSDIKKYLDLIARYKMNIFHWHLTDDQGWRIQIKKYPKLTEIGAWRDSTLIGRYSRTKPQRYEVKRYGGFYTQAQIRDIVQYASQRHITIIPEIEMPGHSEAALASYPKLACTPGPFHVGTRWGGYLDIYCPKEKTFRFLENVLTEVMDLFPSEYIHIGGDEVPKARWKKSKLCQRIIKKYGLKNEEGLQSWFINRIGKFLNAHGRKMIGWDEILEGGIPKNAIVESWRGTSGGIKAAKKGHDVIMAPGGYCYFDHYQANPKFQPIAIGGYTTLKKVYSYNPVPAVLDSLEAKYILGAEGEVWTEYIPNFKKVEYMALPRMAALAEVDWTPENRKNWPDFKRRIARDFLIYKALGYNYCPGSYKVDISVKNENGSTFVSLQSEIYHPDIRFTLDGSVPTTQSGKYSTPFRVQKGTTIKAAVFVNGKLMEVPSVKKIQ